MDHLFQLLRKIVHFFKFPLFWHRKFSSSIKFSSSLYSDPSIPDKRFVNIITRTRQCIGLARKSLLFKKKMISYNKRFTNWVNRAVLEIRSPNFYARPELTRAVRKRSGFVFPGKDQVTRLVNRYYCMPFD